MKKSMSYWHFVQERIIHAYLMYKIETRTFLYVQKKALLKFKSGNEYYSQSVKIRWTNINPDITLSHCSKYAMIGNIST